MVSRACQSTRQHHAETLEFKFCPGVSADIGSLVKTLDARRDVLREPDCECAAQEADSTALTLYESLGSVERVDAQAIDWDDAFRRCPTLACLHLSLAALHSNQLRAILNAVSIHCPQVRALILPLKEQAQADTYKLMTLFQELYNALEKWYARGSDQYLDEEDGFQFSQEDIVQILEGCPALRHLDVIPHRCPTARNGFRARSMTSFLWRCQGSVYVLKYW